MKARLAFLALVALCATAADARILPRTVVLVQTQFYPLRERSRGYLCRYVDNPLCVDPDVPTNRVDGSFLTNEEFERTQREALDYGLDGLVYFPGSERKAYEHGIVSAVSNALNVAMIGFHNPSGFAEDSEHFARALSDPRGYRHKGKTLVLSYWTDKFMSAERLAEIVSTLRRRHGDTFMFVPDIQKVAFYPYKQAFAEHGDLLPEQVAELKDRFRAYAAVGDGLYIGETHMLARSVHGQKVFDEKYYARVVSLAREVLDEPGFRGNKLLVLSAICGHENPSTIGRNVMADGTRTLRNSFAVAAAASPDVIVMPEWDEYNENTCFAPTLYNSYAVKRLVRNLVSGLHSETPQPMAGDSTSVPNLVLSWRKSLSPGEPLYIEVLNIPDGTWSGSVVCGAEVYDERGRLLHAFEESEIDCGRLDEARFEMETAGMAKAARCLRVRFHWSRRKTNARRHYVSGLHPIDFAVANSWNSRVVRQPIRDIAMMLRANFSVKDGVAHADVACKEPIRYVQLCGNGQIQYIRGAPESPCMKFREDADAAVFQISALKWSVAVDRESFFAIDGVSGAEWMRFPWGPVERGKKFGIKWMSMASEPIYLSIPMEDVESAKIDCQFENVLEGSVPLSAAYRLGAYSIGSSNGAQIVVSRFDRQSFYPSALNRKECDFDIRTASDRRSMVYWLQVVTMSGKTWRTRPLVVEASPEDRFSDLRYDFSPSCGDVVRPMSGERRFFGLAGGPCSTASLFNRNGFASGGMASDEYFKTAVDGRPGHGRRSDGEWVLEFDGKDDFVSLPSDTIPLCGDFKVSLDIRPDVETDRMTVMAAKSGSRGSLYRVDVERGKVAVGYSSLEGWVDFLVDQPLEIGQWNQIEISRKGNELFAFVNGVGTSRSCGRIGDSPTAVYLGLSPVGCPFKGGMAKLEISHRQGVDD